TDVTPAAGTIRQGQSVFTLARRSPRGSPLFPSTTLFRSRGSDATFTFPTALDPAAIAGLAVQVNYRGSLRSYVPWFFELWDAARSEERRVGEEGSARGWRWRERVLSEHGPPHRFARGECR